MDAASHVRWYNLQMSSAGAALLLHLLITSFKKKTQHKCLSLPGLLWITNYSIAGLYHSDKVISHADCI